MYVKSLQTHKGQLKEADSSMLTSITKALENEVALPLEHYRQLYLLLVLS